MKTRFICHNAIALVGLALLGTTGCSLMHDIKTIFVPEKEAPLVEIEPSDDVNTTATISPTTPPPTTTPYHQSATKPGVADTVKPGDVELVWKAADDSIVAYHIYYGTSVNDLKEHIRVPITSLRKMLHPAHGPSFRYILTGLDKSKEIFVSLSAENDSGVSEKTPPMKVN